uniref:hypothetical protein n=1 Tax=Staphylococcus haemolyticus TaxID=1283 RepID=UPI001C935C1D
KLFISEIVHTEDSFLLKLYYKFNFATEPQKISGYNESLISKIHYNQIKEGYNEREKYKTQSKLYYFKT